MDRTCTTEQIRSAYRLLAKQVHPDVNGASDAQARTQQINAAYEILADPERRRAYDEELANASQRPRATRSSRGPALKQDIHLRIDEFFRGSTLDVSVMDPGSPAGPELYPLTVPAETAPGTRFTLVRENGGRIIVRALAKPDHRFKVRGSDLRCDLRIMAHRAAQGGTEFVIGPTGTRLRVNIPRGIARGEVVRVAGEGLPRTRGGRGDLLVRVTYRPEVRVTRSTRR